MTVTRDLVTNLAESRGKEVLKCPVSRAKEDSENGGPHVTIDSLRLLRPNQSVTVYLDVIPPTIKKPKSSDSANNSVEIFKISPPLGASSSSSAKCQAPREEKQAKTEDAAAQELQSCPNVNELLDFLQKRIDPIPRSQELPEQQETRSAQLPARSLSCFSDLGTHSDSNFEVKSDYSDDFPFEEMNHRKKSLTVNETINECLIGKEMSFDGDQIRPDTKIKLFSQCHTYEDQTKQLQELKRAEGLVLHLAESIQGNVFNRPFPFIAFRPIPSIEVLPDDLQKDGDPTSDYFFTVRSVRREKGPTLGYIIMGFKVLNDDLMPKLDRDWKTWTRTSELLKRLSKSYVIKRVQCWKANSVKPDIFKYAVMIEISGDDDVEARDILQKFRLKRMSGYVAMYKCWNRKQIDRAMQSNESLGAIIYNLSEG
ncbi:hypothetical protein TCAL_14934 [Tigriopus californicus]|uniref:DUF7153 domain-containing protein n=1 Tax=Tigriopus californicus TaxID=6832 RepID=A0A553N971_TIGCA|nr:hypothetical protein TCAL_14934 [Tigriopus californicus]